MLELLVKYARDMGLEPEPGFKPKDIRWAIICGHDGRFLEVIELGDISQKNNRGQSFPKCPDLSQPEMKAGGETKSHFLVETAEVIALFGKNAGDEKVKEKHNYFIKLLDEAGQVMQELTKLATNLSDQTVLKTMRERMEALKVKANDKVTFKIGDIFPVESDKWHNWWRDYREKLSGLKPNKGQPKRMRCLVTGELGESVLTNPKIEGLANVGGLATGDALISFKQDSFCSYGLVQSENAAVTEKAAADYRAALNHLIRNNSQRLAGTKVVFWFKEKVKPEDDPIPWLFEGSEEQELNASQRARELLESIQTGKRPDIAGNIYYSLNMSGAAGRVMVRDWMEGKFESLVINIKDWFDDLEIVRREGSNLSPEPKFMAVLGATVRELKELPSPFITKMWRSAVRGEMFPQSALAQSLARAKIDIIQDEPFKHARMGLLKAYHVRKNRLSGGEFMSQEVKPYLNEEHPHPAYHCGRLMAVLAALQRRALGDVGAGVIQRYYAAASATPALVFGRLVRTSQFHLSKLEPGLANWYENKIAFIWSRIENAVPTTLDLEEQSLFALGYYQQLADLRTRKSENSDQK